MKLGPGARGATLEAGVWLALAAVAYGLTFQFDEKLYVYRFGAASWPRALILLLVVVALCQMASRLGWFGGGRPRSEPDARPAPPGPPEVSAYLKRAATMALPLLYVFFLPRAGYYAVTPFFVGGYMWLLGERRLHHLVGTALLIYAIVLLIFTKLFFVPLPTGVWPGFYDFSNWFLSLIQ